MDGLMMDCPLTVRGILDRAAAVFPEKRIVSREAGDATHAYAVGEFAARVVRAMNALRDLGVRPGDRVATFAWNNHRHLELYFAAPCMGAVIHTLNIRLSRDQLRYIVRHAEDAVVCVDRSLAAQLGDVLDGAASVRAVVILPDGSDAPVPGFPAVLDYEDALASASDEPRFPDLDERAAAGMCYTSATTGDPKGVVYSHRSFYLHAMGVAMADSFAISERDTVLPIVPMFHANAWGLAHASALVGADLVLPGPHLLGGALADLIREHDVTVAAGVPTVCSLILQHCRHHDARMPSLERMVIGGAAASRSLIEGFERELGVSVIHAWGMTEMSPVGAVCRTKRAMDAWPADDRMAVQVKQGLPVVGVEARIVDDTGSEAPRDGASPGELLVRGPWVASGYYRDDSNADAFTSDGWFRTGDVVTQDAYGYIQVSDRKKDLVKSRGEWISSVLMEGAVMSVPGVLEAAVVGKPDALRGEVPVVYVVADDRSEVPVDARAILSALRQRFERWQLPKAADIRFVPAIPKTSVGKFDKKALRAALAAEQG